jgi:hypothetical protein
VSRIKNQSSGNRQVELFADLGEGRGLIKQKYIVDTGSDFTVDGIDNVKLLLEVPGLVKPPTDEMKRTTLANQSALTCRGYMDRVLKFGEEEAEEKIVIFDGIKTPLLGNEVSQKMGTACIRTDPGKPRCQCVNHIGVEQKTPVGDPKRRARPIEVGETARPKEEPTDLKQLTEKYQEVFTKTDPIPGEKYKIHLSPDAVPVAITNARPILLREPLRKELDELVKNDIIERVTHPTPWCQGLVIEPKKDSNGEFTGKVRVCVDLRPLNKYVQREFYASASVMDTMREVEAGQDKVFSKLDAL